MPRGLHAGEADRLPRPRRSNRPDTRDRTTKSTRRGIDGKPGEPHVLKPSRARSRDRGPGGSSVRLGGQSRPGRTAPCVPCHYHNPLMIVGQLGHGFSSCSIGTRTRDDGNVRGVRYHGRNDSRPTRRGYETSEHGQGGVRSQVTFSKVARQRPCDLRRAHLDERQQFGFDQARGASLLAQDRARGPCQASPENAKK